jgi:type IV pilus assembly protein PilQ
MVLYTQYSPDPLTLVIDLPGVDISGVADKTVVGSREVESIIARRLDGINGKSLSRIEVKLGSLVPYQLSATPHSLTVLFEGAADIEEEIAVQTAIDPPDRLDEPQQWIADEVVASETLPVETETSSYPPASTLERVRHSLTDDLLTVSVEADGRLNYTSFRLDSPNRLVFDFNGVVNGVDRAVMPIEAFGVYQMRVAQFRAASPRITRLVFDLDSEVPHRAVDKGDFIEIQFAATTEKLGGSVADQVAQFSDGAVPEYIQALDSYEGNGVSFNLDGEETAPSALDVAGSIAASLEPVALVAQNATFSASLPEVPEPPPVALLPEPPPQAEVQVEPAPEAYEGAVIGSGESVYTGDLISLDFKDGDIQDIFRLFADISGLNIVVQPGVTGRITLKLSEVPWDQALDLILKTHKLGYATEGNVIRIAPLGELANEEAERRRLDEEKALAGELFTATRQLSYAKSSEMQVLLQRNLSARGDIVIDARTNTLIVTDLADRLENINTLIDTLDTPIPGVEIEARIVVTSRSFSRQFGIQWGFVGHKDQAFGNATELTFPNNILLDGQGLGSGVIEEFKGQSSGGGLTPPQVGADDAQRGYAVNLPMAGFPTGAIGLSLGSITGAFGLDAALSAAESRGQVRILSAPRIITQNNQPATIKQGVTFPVQTIANNTVTVTFKDAVLELTVTPQITSANTVILDMQINNDVVDQSLSVNGIPSIQTQEANTQVLVADGSTTVVGGVFVNQTTKTENYVPLLYKIPVLGWLFKSTDSSDTNRELLIFITPRIRKGVTL